MLGKKMDKFYKKHPMMLAKVMLLWGVGVGILVARPLAGAHPVRWGVGFIVAGFLLKMYAMSKSK